MHLADTSAVGVAECAQGVHKPGREGEGMRLLLRQWGQALQRGKAVRDGANGQEVRSAVLKGSDAVTPACRQTVLQCISMSLYRLII